MKRIWVDTLKPRASPRVQLALAGALWTVVGSGLFAAGLRWILTGEGGAAPPALVLLALGAGLLKSRLVLDRTAKKIVARITVRGEGRCLGGFLSPGSWLLVLAMIAFGRLLRQLIPLPIAGVLYAAIGTGLLVSSRVAWARWLSFPSGGAP